MTDPAREERRELITDDDGDPHTTVYARGGGRDTYHTNRECHQINDPDIYVKTTRVRAQSWIFKPCRACVETVEDRRDTSDGSYLADAIRSAVTTAEADGDDPREAALRTVRDYNHDK